jgi:dihydrofolate synthase/folylpolyglutamate synthase
VTYPEAIQHLLDLRMFGTKLGLDNPRRLAALAGSPHERLRFIHVAGTNGKGSVCAMLESVYREAGLRTGLFTSPHLVSFRERMQVNRELIPEATVARLTARLREWMATFPEGQTPTFFEMVVVMALCHFAEQECDIVLWETGMGGRLDATNIVTPLASVITNVGLDHTRWLGESHAAIAREKSGIIKPGTPAFTATDHPDALAAIRAAAKTHGAELTALGQAEEATDLPLLGKHQQTNARLARAVVDRLQPQLPVSREQVAAGLAKRRTPQTCRCSANISKPTPAWPGPWSIVFSHSCRCRANRSRPAWPRCTGRVDCKRLRLANRCSCLTERTMPRARRSCAGRWPIIFQPGIRHSS